MEHSHDFGQGTRRRGELRTLIVIAITATMMVVEILAGIAYGSMALLADGLHMASHTAALAINAFAYVYARRHAADPRYSFGTGKVNALGGFTGAILLAVFALLMAYESIGRLLAPVPISYSQAILVAVVGFAVNGASMLILGGHGHHDHGAHDHGDHDHGDHDHGAHDHGHADEADGEHDHNLRAAYLHVLADALTSLLAIFALLAAKYLGAVWIDPVIGIVGALLVARWSVGLLRDTSAVLLDRQGPAALRAQIREAIEAPGDATLTDLHLWSVGPKIYSLVLSLETSEPLIVEQLRARLPKDPRLVHITIETRQRCSPG